jgi:hypothetical protein
MQGLKRPLWYHPKWGIWNNEVRFPFYGVTSTLHGFLGGPDLSTSAYRLTGWLRDSGLSFEGLEEDVL